MAALCALGCFAEPQELEFSDVCSEYARYEPPFDPSFAIDVMPRFQVRCNSPSCHGGAPETAQAGLWLGPDRSVTATVEQRAQILQTSLGVRSRTAPSLDRVKAYEPGESFLMLKLDGCQNDPRLACTPQSESATAVGACGSKMPLDAPTAFTEDELDVFRSWIAQGAKDN